MSRRASYSPTEMMTVVAARALRNDDVVFVGIGAPSAACNLARLTHAPDITLIYESGTIGTRPNVLPLSIGDGELADTALTTVAVPEMFRYWLQGGRITVGFLGGAQIDRFANLNTTVVGDYAKPKVRLPGGGGAPEIATQLPGDLHHHGDGAARLRRKAALHHLARSRHRAGEPRSARREDQRPDQGHHRPLPDGARSGDARADRHRDSIPGTTREKVEAECGWPVKFAATLSDDCRRPPREELAVLRELQQRTSGRAWRATPELV